MDYRALQWDFRQRGGQASRKPLGETEELDGANSIQDTSPIEANVETLSPFIHVTCSNSATPQHTSSHPRPRPPLTPSVPTHC